MQLGNRMRDDPQIKLHDELGPSNQMSTFPNVLILEAILEKSRRILAEGSRKPEDGLTLRNYRPKGAPTYSPAIF